jgi:hypothetical protein
VHAGSIVAACATAAAALVALAFLPARARSGGRSEEKALSGTQRADSRAQQLSASQR